MNIAASLIKQLGDAIAGVSGNIDDLINIVHQQLDETIALRATVNVDQEPEGLDSTVSGLRSIMVSVESLAKQFLHLSEVYVALAAQPLAVMAREIEEAAERLRNAQQDDPDTDANASADANEGR